MEEEIEDGGAQLPPTRVGHIKKRALKNKSLSVSFNEKDLKDYVTGFHKRKKKRRKEAQKQQEEALRRKRIELRKKRKQELELAIHGGSPPETASDEGDENHEDDEGKPIPPINGTTMYDNGNMKVTVTTSEIYREDEDGPGKKPQLSALPISVGAEKKHNLSVTKGKSFKKGSKSKSRPKPQNKRDRKKGKKKNKR